jgi:tyrosyl-tRNA synthetase
MEQNLVNQQLGRYGWTHEKTSPYTFYQFWLNSADADVGSFLKLFTFLDQQEIAGLEALMEEHPERREAHRKLAQEVTGLVHGADAVIAAERISASLFSGDTQSLLERDLNELAARRAFQQRLRAGGRHLDGAC